MRKKVKNYLKPFLMPIISAIISAIIFGIFGLIKSGFTYENYKNIQSTGDFVNKAFVLEARADVSKEIDTKTQILKIESEKKMDNIDKRLINLENTTNQIYQILLKR